MLCELIADCCACVARPVSKVGSTPRRHSTDPEIQMKTIYRIGATALLLGAPAGTQAKVKYEVLPTVVLHDRHLEN